MSNEQGKGLDAALSAVLKDINNKFLVSIGLEDQDTKIVICRPNGKFAMSILEQNRFRDHSDLADIFGMNGREIEIDGVGGPFLEIDGQDTVINCARYAHLRYGSADFSMILEAISDSVDYKLPEDLCRIVAACPQAEDCEADEFPVYDLKTAQGSDIRYFELVRHGDAFYCTFQKDNNATPQRLTVEAIADLLDDFEILDYAYRGNPFDPDDDNETEEKDCQFGPLTARQVVALLHMMQLTINHQDTEAAQDCFYEEGALKKLSDSLDAFEMFNLINKKKGEEPRKNFAFPYKIANTPIQRIVVQKLDDSDRYICAFSTAPADTPDLGEDLILTDEAIEMLGIDDFESVKYADECEDFDLPDAFYGAFDLAGLKQFYSQLYFSDKLDHASGYEALFEKFPAEDTASAAPVRIAAILEDLPNDDYTNFAYFPEDQSDVHIILEIQIHKSGDKYHIGAINKDNKSLSPEELYGLIGTKCPLSEYENPICGGHTTGPFDQDEVVAILSDIAPEHSVLFHTPKNLDTQKESPPVIYEGVIPSAMSPKFNGEGSLPRLKTINAEDLVEQKLIDTILYMAHQSKSDGRPKVFETAGSQCEVHAATIIADESGRYALEFLTYEDGEPLAIGIESIMEVIGDEELLELCKPHMSSYEADDDEHYLLSELEEAQLVAFLKAYFYSDCNDPNRGKIIKSIQEFKDHEQQRYTQVHQITNTGTLNFGLN